MEDFKYSPKFCFDDLNILAVFGTTVYLKGSFKESNDCVILLDKSLFKKALDLWLKDKKDYCERYNHFCGVGYIEADEYEESKEQVDLNIFIEDDSLEYGGEYKSILFKTFIVYSIEESANMEHG